MHFFCFSYPKPTAPKSTLPKIGQGQLKVIIYINSVELTPQLLHTKYHGNRPSGTGVDFFKVFVVNGQSGHLGHETRTKIFNLSFPSAWRLNMGLM